MIIHTLISAYTRMHGGKKSAGRERVDVPVEMYHYTGEELIGRLEQLHGEGYAVDVSVLAHRDRRKPQVQLWYPANVCPECRAYRIANKEDCHLDG
jgi:hypothetical protein